MGLRQKRRMAKQDPELVDLVERAKARDEAAFEALYHRYKRMVYTLTFRMTHEISAAEDLTQEVFLLVWRKIGTFRGEASFSTWLYRLTLNECRGFFRKTHVDARTVDLEDVTAATKPEEGHSVFRTRLEEAIARLPKGYREVFVLHDVQGKNHEEIAQILGCSVGNSKSQLFKARARLKQMLAPYYGGEKLELSRLEEAAAHPLR